MIEEKTPKGCVYFFRHVGLTPVKLGYSENQSPLSRFQQFKTYAPYGGELLGFIVTDAAKEMETKLHIKFNDKRLMGEWFEITEEDVNAEILYRTSLENAEHRNRFQIAYAKKVDADYEQLDWTPQKRKVRRLTILENAESDIEKYMFKLNYEPGYGRTSKIVAYKCDLYDGYIKYCTDAYVAPITSNQFTEVIKKIGFSVRRDSKGMYVPVHLIEGSEDSVAI